MTATPVSILWRRLDLEGHDGCLLSRTDSGHSLEGQAIFIQDDKPCCLAYRVDCDTGCVPSRRASTALSAVAGCIIQSNGIPAAGGC
ncbi:putative glycolipid-binding domain-containing protein [Mesorhizobium sp. WSM3626]|uniref:putative glycolipid-binding domain-containing protein n=1 Tax=Mesorhizobium sp. WSM3626 TaxID=1040987 RepID=UPI001FD96FA1|nr:putative glycolipid-binding domain-containing protein [Mesorhizobium sp. WSM3626]